jgi:hypothetical protein
MGARLFIRTIVFIVPSLVPVWCGIAWAEPWAVVANSNDRSISTIDLGTNPPTVHGPFLGGQLGASGSLLDVAITPDERYALVSNYDLNTVYRVDFSNPASPSVAGSVNIGFPAEDIAVAANGQFALVADGDPSNKIAIINLTFFTLTTTYTLTTPGAGAQAIAIAADSQTAIICDYTNNRIIYGIVTPITGLTSENTLPTRDGPINVAISPDGQTVLVASINDIQHHMSVFQITAPGVVVPGITSDVSILPGGDQSVAFSPDGANAYVVSVNHVDPPDPNPDRLSWLVVNGPGNVTMGTAGVASLFSRSASCFSGVDVLAITPNGSYALAANPGNGAEDIPSNDVAMVNLSDWSVTTLNTNSTYPAGIAVFGDYPPPTPTATATPNYLELRVRPNASGGFDFKQGDAVVLEWETFESLYGYENVPCAVYLGAVMDFTPENQPATVQQITSSKALYLFNSKKQAARYSQGAAKPMYRGVRFPVPNIGSSGTITFTAPRGAAGRWVFAAALSRADGRGFPADPPIEVSNGFNLQ